MANGGHFENMVTPKDCGRDILRTFGWISLKFDVVVLWVFLMIWLTFGENPLKTRWLTEDIWKKYPPKNLVGAISYEAGEPTQLEDRENKNTKAHAHYNIYVIYIWQHQMPWFETKLNWSTMFDEILNCSQQKNRYI